MTDITKLKHVRSRLGSPPAATEASENLSAPEHAPAAARKKGGKAGKADTAYRETYRALRRTGRTVQFNTRVTTEWDERIRQIAAERNLKLAEVLEKALDAYEHVME